MKKRLLFVAAIFAATATFAQDGLTSKKGEAYLPEAGDWAIGIDANPFLNYAGNLFSGSTAKNTIDTGATWFAPNMAIYGKYFKDEKTAYRAMVRIGFESNTVKNISDTTDANGTKLPIEDERKISSNNITLGFGMEKRRGNTRIQGVYGAMFNISFGGGKTTYDYGDTRNDDHSSRYTDWDLWNGNTIIGDTATILGNAARTTENKKGSTFSLGLNGFIGVEWFFAPKVSLGAEYTWGLALSSTGEGEITTEAWRYATPTATANSNVVETSKTGKSSSFGIDTGISGAIISLNFHF